MKTQNHSVIEPLEELRYTDAILDIIDNRDEFTRGDLQGAVAAVVMNIIRETRTGKK